MTKSQPSKFLSHLNIQYKNETNHAKHHLDLYLPNSSQNLSPPPMVVFVHGGGWRRGDRGTHILWGRANVGRALASQGFACAVISYRLSKIPIFTMVWIVTLMAFAFSAALATLYLLLGTMFGAASSFWQSFVTGSTSEELWGVTLSIQALGYLYVLSFLAAFLFHYLNEPSEPVSHPGHIEDVSSALKWVLDSSDKYNYNKQQIFLSGHSAGAHLVTLLALDHQYIHDVGISSEQFYESVKGIIGISGPYNITRMCTPTGSHKFLKFMARQVYGISAFGYDEEVYKQASAITHVEKASNVISKFKENPSKLAFLLLNAQSDHWLAEDAKELKEQLEKSEHFPVEHRIIRNTNHRTIITRMSHPVKDTITPIIFDFIERQLKSNN